MTAEQNRGESFVVDHEPVLQFFRYMVETDTSFGTVDGQIQASIDTLTEYIRQLKAEHSERLFDMLKMLTLCFWHEHLDIKKFALRVTNDTSEETQSALNTLVGLRGNLQTLSHDLHNTDSSTESVLEKTQRFFDLIAPLQSENVLYDLLDSEGKKSIKKMQDLVFEIELSLKKK